MTARQPVSVHAIYYSQTPKYIACTLLLKAELPSGGPGVCLFLQSNISAVGVSAYVIKSRLALLMVYECKTCGSFPISDDGDPKKMGEVTSDYIQHTSRNGICDIPVLVMNITSGLESSTSVMSLTDTTRENFNCSGK